MSSLKKKEKLYLTETSAITNPIGLFLLNNAHGSIQCDRLLNVKLSCLNSRLYYISWPLISHAVVPDVSQLFNICRFVFPAQSKIGLWIEWISHAWCLSCCLHALCPLSEACNKIPEHAQCTTQILSGSTPFGIATRNPEQQLRNMSAPPLLLQIPCHRRWKMNSSVSGPQVKLAFPPVTSSHW